MDDYGTPLAQAGGLLPADKRYLQDDFDRLAREMDGGVDAHLLKYGQYDVGAALFQGGEYNHAFKRLAKELLGALNSGRLCAVGRRGSLDASSIPIRKAHIPYIKLDVKAFRRSDLTIQGGRWYDVRLFDPDAGARVARPQETKLDPAVERSVSAADIEQPVVAQEPVTVAQAVSAPKLRMSWVEVIDTLLAMENIGGMTSDEILGEARKMRPDLSDNHFREKLKSEIRKVAQERDIRLRGRGRPQKK